jgi:acyl carrier protein
MPDDAQQILADYVATSILKQPNKSIAPGDRLLSSGLVDSFSLVDLAIFIEERFGVQIADTELNEQTFDTLAELSALVEERRK